jgi:hypothetical protein
MTPAHGFPILAASPLGSDGICVYDFKDYQMFQFVFKVISWDHDHLLLFLLMIATIPLKEFFFSRLREIFGWQVCHFGNLVNR